jgi:hypothetical protein
MATLKLAFVLAILLALVVVGMKVIPPYFANYELEDSIRTEALQATYTTRTEDDIRNAVIKEARKYEIVLTPKQIHITRTGGIATGTLSIEAEYSIPIELPGYSTIIQFHPSTQNKGVF